MVQTTPVVVAIDKVLPKTLLFTVFGFEQCNSLHFFVTKYERDFYCVVLIYRKKTFKNQLYVQCTLINLG